MDDRPPETPGLATVPSGVRQRSLSGLRGPVCHAPAAEAHHMQTAIARRKQDIREMERRILADIRRGESSGRRHRRAPGVGDDGPSQPGSVMVVNGSPRPPSTRCTGEYAHLRGDSAQGRAGVSSEYCELGQSRRIVAGAVPRPRRSAIDSLPPTP